jgi:hypothetical protein
MKQAVRTVTSLTFRDWENYEIFYVRGSVHREICVNNCPTRCNNIHFTYICKLLYMFREVNPLIIRSSYHCTCSIWHYWDRTATCLERDWMGTAFPSSPMPDTADTVIWAPDDEWSYLSKHVQKFTNINKLYIAAFCCTIIDIKLRNFNSDNWYNSPYSSTCSQKWHGWGTWAIFLLTVLELYIFRSEFLFTYFQTQCYRLLYVYITTFRPTDDVSALRRLYSDTEKFTVVT